MATVPTAQGRDRVAPEVRRVVAQTPLAYQTTPQQYETSRGVTEEAFGAALAQSQIATGKQGMEGSLKLLDLASKIQNDDNVREAKKLDSDFKAFKIQVGFGDGTEDGDRGYYAKLGEDAVKGANLAKKALQDQREKMLAGASNDRVRELFKYHSDEQILAESATIDRHQLTQRVVAEDSAAQGRIAVSQDEAAKKYTDPALFEKARQVTYTETYDRLVAKGVKDPAAQAAALQQALAPMVQNAFNNAMANEDIATAAKILGGNRDAIPAALSAQLGEKLKGEVDTRAAQIIVDEVRKLGLKGEDARAYIRENTSGKIRDNALSNLQREVAAAQNDISFSISMTHFAQGQADRKAKETGQKLADSVPDALKADDKAVEREKWIKENAKSAEERNIALAESRKDQATREHVRTLATQEQQRREHAEDRARKEQERTDNAMVVDRIFVKGEGLESIPYEVKSRLSRETMAAIDERIKKGGFPALTGQDGFKFMVDLERMTPQQRAEVNLPKMATILSKEDYDTAKRLVLDGVAGKGGKDQFGTVDQKLAQTADQLKLFGEGKRDDRGSFLLWAHAEIAKAEAANGNRPLNFNEVDKVIADVKKKYVEKGWFGSTSVKPFSEGVVTVVPKEQQIEPTKAASNEITIGFERKNGRPPTPEEIKAIYNNAIFSNKGAR